MARSRQERAEEQREKAKQYDVVATALEDLRDEVNNADSIGETRLSELFHEARTNRPDIWKSASAFVDIEDGEAVVKDVSKLRDGRWAPEVRDRHDAVVSVGVRAFMETDIFKSLARDDLHQRIQAAKQNAGTCRMRAEDLENLQEHR